MNLRMTIFLLVCLGFSLAEDDIVIQLWEKKGRIRGHVLKSGKGLDYYAFQNIPYAAPPTGQNRFKEPKEPDDWEGILNTTVNERVCMQNNATAYTKIPNSMEISEDCLFLNVYTPMKPGNIEKASLSVLFWIHGGGYLFGSGAFQYYNPKFFIDADVVVVTINYRLGPFGKIQGFILESGSPLSPVAIQDDPRHFAFSMGKVLDSTFKSNRSEDLLDLLLKTPAIRISEADVPNDRYTAKVIGRNSIWTPTIENGGNPSAAVTKPMHEALIIGDFIQAPLLTGFCSEEFRIFFKNLTVEEIARIGGSYDQNASYIIDSRLHVADNDVGIAASKYKSIYTNGTFKNDPGAFIRFLSGDTFITPASRHAELASKFSPVYLYQFSYQGVMDGLLYLPNVTGTESVAHTAELKYFFEGVAGHAGDPTDYPESDQLTMKRLLVLWTNFIKYQNPTPNLNPTLENIVWPRVRGDNIQYLNINHTLEILSNPKSYDDVKRVLNNYMNPPLVVF
ncbi:juvenile hormone esterase isoform X3 [Leptinotarsa decemlineata]|uniref:juvenile hormone esterase isoform X3 n=1 Tax=Leptinotarsa decemlineata TaxID=7539 RepID=UPI003D304ADB